VRTSARRAGKARSQITVVPLSRPYPLRQGPARPELFVEIQDHADARCDAAAIGRQAL